MSASAKHEYPLDLPDVHALGRKGLGVLVGGGLLVAAWVSFAPLSGAVIASGAIKVDDSRKTIAHLEGGIVDEILVRDGDHVQAGQVLVRMRDASVSASVDLLSSQYLGELARSARLLAERDGATTIAWPPELLRQKGSVKIMQIMRGEERLFAVRLQSVEDQLKSLREQLLHAQREVKDYESGIASGTKSVDLANEDLKSNEQLVEKNFVSKQRLIAIRRDLAETESRQADRHAEMAKTRQRISDIETRMVTLRANRTQQAADELEQSRRRVFDLQERLRPSQDAQTRLQVVAPMAGEVVGLRIHTAGGVVSPREPLLDLVPDNKGVVIEARVAVEDIDEVRHDRLADVRLSAYPQRNTPLLTGKVTYVSADRAEDPKTGIAFFTAHVRVDPAALADYPNIHMTPGMPVEVFFRTHDRTVLDYLLAPLIQSMRRAGREG